MKVLLREVKNSVTVEIKGKSRQKVSSILKGKIRIRLKQEYYLFTVFVIFTDELTFQSFSKGLQESFELHLLHRSQNVSCIQSFPFGFHGKVVRTVTKTRK